MPGEANIDFSEKLKASFDNPAYDFLEVGLGDAADKEQPMKDFRRCCDDVWDALAKVACQFWQEAWNETWDIPTKHDFGKIIFQAGDNLLAQTCWIESFQRVLTDAMYDDTFDSEEHQYANFMVAVLTAEYVHWKSLVYEETKKEA